MNINIKNIYIDNSMQMQSVLFPNVQLTRTCDSENKDFEIHETAWLT